MTIYNLTINDDTYNGDASNDVFKGPAGGDDVLRGKGGNDTFTVRSGQKGLADGGTGRDTLHLQGGDYGALDDGFKIVGMEKLVVDSTELFATIDQLDSFSQFDVGNGFRFLLQGKGGALDFSGSVVKTQKLEIEAGLTKSSVNITGSVKNDLIDGSIFADKLNGHKGDDKVYGNTGNDTINGGLGKDYLEGDVGKDTFVFSTKLGPTNVDHIGEYSVKDDSIKLDRHIFKWAGQHGGEIESSEFKVIGSGQKQDADDHILYNKKSGALYYDADGAGGHAMVKFAVLGHELGSVPALTYHDILIG